MQTRKSIAGQTSKEQTMQEGVRQKKKTQGERKTEQQEQVSHTHVQNKEGAKKGGTIAPRAARLISCARAPLAGDFRFSF